MLSRKEVGKEKEDRIQTLKTIEAIDMQGNKQRNTVTKQIKITKNKEIEPNAHAINAILKHIQCQENTINKKVLFWV